MIVVAGACGGLFWEERGLRIPCFIICVCSLALLSFSDSFYLFFSFFLSRIVVFYGCLSMHVAVLRVCV